MEHGIYKLIPTHAIYVLGDTKNRVAKKGDLLVNSISGEFIMCKDKGEMQPFTYRVVALYPNITPLPDLEVKDKFKVHSPTDVVVVKEYKTYVVKRIIKNSIEETQFNFNFSK